MRDSKKERSKHAEWRFPVRIKFQKTIKPTLPIMRGQTHNLYNLYHKLPVTKPSFFSHAIGEAVLSTALEDNLNINMQSCSK